MEALDKRTSHLLDVHLKDYDATRGEIVLRLKEKNSLTRYLMLLIAAVITGLWSDKTDNPDSAVLMIIFLVIIPVISLVLVLLYNWHDECIAKLAFYLNGELRPKICALLDTDEILTREEFLSKSRKNTSFISYPNLGRLIFVIPTLTSVLGYIVIVSIKDFYHAKLFLMALDALVIIIIMASFANINAKYRMITT